MLLVHGTSDAFVPTYTSLRIHELLPDSSTLKLVEGSDHCYSSMEHEAELINIIKEYCSKNLNKE